MKNNRKVTKHIKNISKFMLSIMLIMSMIVNTNSFVYASTSDSSNLTYYYVEQETDLYTVWDFVDIAMAGESWYHLLNEPSLKNLTWAILDTAAIAPIIPSTKWIRQGAKYSIPISEIKKLASTASGKSKLIKSLKVTSKSSKLKEIANLAKNYTLTESRYQNHILKNHGFNSTIANKSRFNRSFNIKKGIKDTLTNDSIIKNNTNSRDGYIFEKTYSYAIGIASDGKTPLKRLKVVLNTSGQVVTAYPIK